MARIGYIRVSTDEQDTIRQEDLMKAQALDKVFTEKISGKDTNRPAYQAMMQYLRAGDVLIIESYSRIARNARDMLEIADELKRKEVALVSLKEKVDTSTPQGQFVFVVFAGLYQLEREQTLQRQAEGIACKKAIDAERKAQGLKPMYYTGRKPIEVNENRLRLEVHLVREGKQTHEEAAHALGLKTSTYYRKIKALGL